MAVSVAVSIGERFISVASVTQKNNLIIPKVLAIEPTPVNIYIDESPEASNQLTTLLSKMLSEASISSHQANIVVPDARCYMRISQMPSLTEKEMISAIRYQADQFIPLPMDKVSLDLEVLSEDKKNKTQTVFLVACATSLVDRVSQIVERGGLAPICLEGEATAFLRLISLLPENPKEPVATGLQLFINFSPSATTLYLYDPRARKPLEILSLSTGYDLFAKDIQANLQISNSDTARLLHEVGFSGAESPYKIDTILQAPYSELSRQLSQFVQSSREKFGSPIVAGHLFGEGTAIAAFDKKIAASIAIPVSGFDPSSLLQNNEVTAYFKKSLPVLAITLGGAIREDL